jgi:hypothetical protein
MWSFSNRKYEKDKINELIVKTPEELSAYVDKQSKVSPECRRFEVLCEIFAELKHTDNKEFFGRLLKYIEETNAPVFHPADCEDCDNFYRHYALYNVLEYTSPFLMETIMLCHKKGAIFNTLSEEEHDFWLIQDLFENGAKHDDNESIWILSEYVKAKGLEELKYAMNHENIEEMCITKNVFEHLEYMGVEFCNRFLNASKWVKDGTVLVWKLKKQKLNCAIKTVCSNKQKKAKKDDNDDQ